MKNITSAWAKGRHFMVRLWLGMMTACMLLLAPAAATAAGFAVNTSTAALSGLWWNANESGWGMSVTQQGPIIFVAWFVYEPSGAPVWYVMSNCAVAADGCSGDIYKVAGGTSPAVPWNGAGKQVDKVGSGTLAFADANTGSFNYTLNGTSGSKSIARQMFASGTTAPATDYTALWWNETESGWGVALTQQFNKIFAAWYAYDSNGKPVWYVASDCVMSGNACAGDLYQVTGGTAPTVAWNGGSLAVNKVGVISFSFSGAAAGTMSYTLNGVSGTKAITKQIFYTAPGTGTGGGSGDSSVCASTALIANGASYQSVIRSFLDGSAVQDAKNLHLVTTGVNFRGVSAYESKVDTTITSGVGTGTTNLSRSYFNQTASQSILYGIINQTSMMGFTVDSTIVFDPIVTYPLAQNPGDVHTQTYKMTTTMSGLPVAVPVPDVTQTTSRKFIGIERVSVIAGSFNACRFEDSVNVAGGGSTVTNNWFYAGGAPAGAFLKSSSVADGKTTVVELVSMTVPGGGALPAN